MTNAHLILRLVLALAFALFVTISTGMNLARAQDYTPVIGIDRIAPIGERDFCARYPAECQPALEIVLDLTTAQLQAVARVNRQVNHQLTYVTDLDHWGAPEQWDLPSDGRGDCEEFVLEKRRRLLELGLPRGALLITVALTPKGERHAVLTLRTTYGDFILDMGQDLVTPWERTNLTFLARQDPEHPGRWKRLNGQGRGQS